MGNSVNARSTLNLREVKSQTLVTAWS